jgi:prepilin-type N-terminal cleavage/methylation domain-containing protein
VKHLMFTQLKKAFTLIELLIVIVIIGVLAVAVLSAINPIEQIKKAQDAGKRSDSAELLNALERYYTTYQQYPWERTNPVIAVPDIGDAAVPVATPGANPGDPVDVAAWLIDPAGAELATLIATDELKQEFGARDSLTSLYVFHDADDTDLVTVCFPPESQTSRLQARYLPTGEDVTDYANECTFLDAATTCLMCVPE